MPCWGGSIADLFGRTIAPSHHTPRSIHRSNPEKAQTRISDSPVCKTVETWAHDLHSRSQKHWRYSSDPNLPEFYRPNHSHDDRCLVGVSNSSFHVNPIVFNEERKWDSSADGERSSVWAICNLIESLVALQTSELYQRPPLQAEALGASNLHWPPALPS